MLDKLTESSAHEHRDIGDSQEDAQQLTVEWVTFTVFWFCFFLLNSGLLYVSRWVDSLDVDTLGLCFQDRHKLLQPVQVALLDFLLVHH